MTTLTASKARVGLYKLLDKTAESHEPIQITGKRHSAVLVSEEDWASIQETLYLLSIPGMRESIRKGLKTLIGKKILDAERQIARGNTVSWPEIKRRHKL